MTDMKKDPIRHAEKRRNSTCRFADRIARFCVDHYKEHVPLSFQEDQRQTCLAAIVAFASGDIVRSVTDDAKAPGKFAEASLKQDAEANGDLTSGCLYMMGMGVGTKFLSRDVLQEERLRGADGGDMAYGRRVRDCHAEVLARRAFRRQLTLCMLHNLDHFESECCPPILERTYGEGGAITFKLKPAVSLHMYTSSAPCGNATLKKFATMKKESFREDLGNYEWPQEPHEPILGHSISLGQFALLVKKDPGTTTAPVLSGCRAGKDPHQKTSAKQCPARESTDWCPPGTSTVWSGHGSLHTCSDKICRWNYLGLQGSLLAPALERPLYMKSLTVGRKLTECICRRAVCCRAPAGKTKARKKRTQTDAEGTDSGYTINHPAIMGTAVYMDDNAVVIDNEDVRFHSILSWAWWPSIAMDQSTDQEQANLTAECINGTTGFAVVQRDNTSNPQSASEAVSRISTAALLELQCRLKTALDKSLPTTAAFAADHESSSRSRGATLKSLREYKRGCSPLYEAQKDMLLSKHPLFRQWKRRELEEE